MSVEFLLRWISIVVLDLSLAGDNALVIAMAVRTLPPRQQKIGIFWGAFGAVALRITLVFITAQLLRMPFLQAAGGVVLIWIALRLLRQDAGAEGSVKLGTTLAEAIRIIIFADVIMSLDNVLGIAAASRGNLSLLLFGLGLSIPIVMWGASFIARLMNTYPWIVYIGGAILGWVAGEMLVEDRIVHKWLEPFGRSLRWLVPAALAVGIVIVGKWWIAGRKVPPAEKGG